MMIIKFKMKKILFLFIISFLLQSCDDGDIIITTFNFDDADLEVCGELGDFVFYKVNPEAQESLSLKLGVTDSIYKTAGTKSYNINGTTNVVNYRTYDGALGTDYFCRSVPPTSPKVTVNYTASDGKAEFTTIFDFDDNDGIPVLKELDTKDADGDGDPYTNPLDTDGDGIPNYYDADDDGDNVPTALELDIENLDGDDNPLTNPLDTDKDGIPDYLDEDDDGDGVLTRDEDKNMDLNPRNDVEDPSVGADYLNINVENDYNVNEYAKHKYTITKSVKIVLKNVVLVSDDEEITQESLNMGILEKVESINKTTKPDFK